MKVLYTLLLAVIPVASAAASCKKDTATATPRSLFGSPHLKALHVDETGGSAMMNGQTQPILEARLAVAFCRWPSYTAALVGGSHMATVTTSYLAIGSRDLHPSLLASWSGIELQKRWRDSSIFHPMVSVAIGEITTSYHYLLYKGSMPMEWQTEGRSSARYFTPAAGVEMSLFKYMTSYLLVGFRDVGSLATPALERGGFNGQYVAFGFGFGKFR